MALPVFNDPSIKISIQGDDIDNSVNTYTWVQENKTEVTVNLQGTAPVSPSTTWTPGTTYILSYGNIADPYVLLVFGDGLGTFSINLNFSQTIGGTPTALTLALNNDGTIPTILNLSAAWLATLTSISLVTSSAVVTQIFIGIYGAQSHTP
jgi:hypothetical protein